jgi:D-alanyl-lipoteichoic acid acyltransferase DltB (MBOAT superfamily)
MNAKKAYAKGGKRASNWALMKEIWSQLGFKGLWIGVGPRCVMVGTLSAVMFLIYDSVKVISGLSTSTGLQNETSPKPRK